MNPSTANAVEIPGKNPGLEPFSCSSAMSRSDYFQPYAAVASSKQLQFRSAPRPKRAQAAGLAGGGSLARSGGWRLRIWLSNSPQQKQGEWMSRLSTRLTSADIDVHVAAAELDKTLRDAKGSIPLRLIVDYVQRWTVDLTLTASGLPVRYFVGQQDTIMSVVSGGFPFRYSSVFIVGWYRSTAPGGATAQRAAIPRNLFLDYRSLFANNHGT